MSSIYINPDDFLNNVESVAAEDRHIYAESIIRQIEGYDYSSKRQNGESTVTIGNFAEELERAERIMR